jgi:membrane protein YqaA with SNARE-associated domain
VLKKLYDWMMAKSAHPHALWWLAAFSFMEASFFPIPPHPLLGLMCLAQPRRAIHFAAVCTAASVLGGLFGYAIGYFLYETVGTAMLAALGLADNFPEAACYLRLYGAEIILIKGATPIPFKLLTITAGFIKMDLLTFLLASIVSRGVLFMAVGILFRMFGAPIKAFIEKYLGLMTAAFLILLVGGFVIAGMASGEARADACRDAGTEAPPALSSPRT